MLFEHSEYLFSYGTLRYESVQIGTFGRLLEGQPDCLPGFFLKTVKITDPDVIAKSGQDVHPILYFSGDLKDQIPGTVFKVSKEDLKQADKYEVGDYKRTLVKLASGIMAWVYIAAATHRSYGLNV